MSASDGKAKRDVLEQLKRCQHRPIRLIALDLDGTVYNDRKEISGQTVQAIRRATASGIHVLPASGRPLDGIDPRFLAIDGVRFCIYSNGAAVRDEKTKTIVYHRCLKKETLELLFDQLECLDGTFELYRDGSVYASRRQKEHWETWIPNAAIRAYVERTRILVDGSMREFYRTAGGFVEKVNCSYGDPSERQKALERLQQIPGIVVTSGLPENIEINEEKADKGEALLALARHLGIPREETMACGDSSNDAAMIVKSGCGAAMGNADWQIKQLADVQTCSNEEDGVAVLLHAVVDWNAQFGL